MVDFSTPTAQESFNVSLQSLNKMLFKLSLEDRFSCDCFEEGSQSCNWNREKNNPSSFVTSKHPLGGLKGD